MNTERMLVFRSGPNEGCTVPLGEDGLLRVGRDEELDLTVPDPTVSAHHCNLRIAGTEVEIVDVGSRNGTFVNGVRIERQPLHPGDELLFGLSRVQLVVDRRGDAPVTADRVLGRHAVPADARSYAAKLTRGPGDPDAGLQRLACLSSVEEILARANPLPATFEAVLEVVVDHLGPERGLHRDLELPPDAPGDRRPPRGPAAQARSRALDHRRSPPVPQRRDLGRLDRGVGCHRDADGGGRPRAPRRRGARNPLLRPDPGRPGSGRLRAPGHPRAPDRAVGPPARGRLRPPGEDPVPGGALAGLRHLLPVEPPGRGVRLSPRRRPRDRGRRERPGRGPSLRRDGPESWPPGAWGRPATRRSRRPRRPTRAPTPSGSTSGPSATWSSPSSTPRSPW